MSKVRSLQELERIRADDAKVQEAKIKARVPEKIEYVPLCYFELGRYTTGAFRGLFAVYQWIYTEGKEPERKTLIEGVDIHIAMTTMETATRRRVYR